MYAYQHTSLSLFVDWLRLIAPYIGFCMQPIARCLCRISSKSHYIKLTYDLGKIWSIKDTKNKEDILKNVVTKQFWLPLTSIILYVWTNKPKNTKTFLEISSFMLHQRKQVIQVWNDMRVSKWLHFHFGLNYPFNWIILLLIIVI